MKHKISAVLLLFLFCVTTISGVIGQTAYAGTCKPAQKFLTIDPWYFGLCKDNTSDVEITRIPEDIVVIALNVISIAIQLGGYVAIGYVMWGGTRYITANGDSGKIASAKTTIMNALIGLLLTLSAVAIVNFVRDNIK